MHLDDHILFAEEARKGRYQFRPFPTEIMGTIPKCLSITQRSEFEKRTQHGLISRKWQLTRTGTIAAFECQAHSASIWRSLPEFRMCGEGKSRYEGQVLTLSRSRVRMSRNTCQQDRRESESPLVARDSAYYSLVAVHPPIRYVSAQSLAG